jgi:hypothetical protein
METLKKQIFDKFKQYLDEPVKRDCFGNEYYISHGIKVIHVTKSGLYKWGNENLADSPQIKPFGYHVISCLRYNYNVIESFTLLRYINNFDLSERHTVTEDGVSVTRPLSIHKRMKGKFTVEFKGLYKFRSLFLQPTQGIIN